MRGGGARGRIIIIAPTRELAEQIHQTTLPLCRQLRLHSLTLYGGVKKLAETLFSESSSSFRRVVLIDDSIVRGTTSLKIVRMVREAGAKEVHLRSASPPILWPDFYGIDMPERDQLLAATKTMEEMVQMLEVDSLGFLSVGGLYEALGVGPRNDAQPQFTDHYFTGDYPTRLTDREIAEGRNESNDKQLSLLSA